MSYATFVELIEELRKDMIKADQAYAVDQDEAPYDAIYTQCKFLAAKFSTIDKHEAVQKIWEFLACDDENIGTLYMDITGMRP